MNRRQPFITEAYYKNLVGFYDASESYWSTHNLEEDFPGQEASLKAFEVKQDSLGALIIRYTAGEPISELFEPLERVVRNFELYQNALAEYEGVPNISPLDLEDSPADFEEFVQVASLCILLHRNDLLARFVSLTDAAGFNSEDTLYEDLLRKNLAGRADIDEWFHPVYTKLIRSIYASSKTEASKLLNEYCGQWYESFGELQASWHDAHLSIDGDDGSYVGYWAFEAGAIAFLYGIDDSKIDHMVYPKDLVEYARNYTGSSISQVGRVDSGQPCSKQGYWFTPAQANSRRYFKQGEIMPNVDDSRWGDTIWYWSGE
ncbi:hypothetical protein PS925_02628 [Pseudomonas fluorescens]|uniref:PoNi C-terminal domain-containing protein n=1 Tax=Pseudomonas fluorescens TaxID=294 RepID=A0A5E7U1F5_PSEFL|nr:PoNe immunity protein domain-containing protein [Pseudomonas fluorescens]VVQ04329.1 hypothetical protein PS925_02628 [Pseudomonas fluorescens]